MIPASLKHMQELNAREMEDRKQDCIPCKQTAQQRYGHVLDRLTAGMEELDAQRYRSYYLMRLHGMKLSQEQQADYDRLKGQVND